MESTGTSVLVVDDDVSMLKIMRRTLELEGYRVATAGTGEAALEMFDKETPDLMLLDIMMPGMSGYEVCRRVREFSELPIIMITAKAGEEEKIVGLDAGADDYVTKPFSAGELMARVRAVLRRATLREVGPEPPFRSQDLVVDFARQTVSIGGEEVNLTATEYRLLSHLSRKAGQEVDPDEILREVWGEDYVGEHHILRANMGRLRRKLKALEDSWPTGLKREDWLPQ